MLTNIGHIGVASIMLLSDACMIALMKAPCGDRSIDPMVTHHPQRLVKPSSPTTDQPRLTCSSH
jgi:hypothetical protein